MDNHEARKNFLDDLKRYARFKPGELIEKWRSSQCFGVKSRDAYGEIVMAIIDALTQEGQVAWNGDGTSIVAQYVTTQIERAERAERDLEQIRKLVNGIV